jgi:hypothetical protein
VNSNTGKTQAPQRKRLLRDTREKGQMFAINHMSAAGLAG